VVAQAISVAPVEIPSADIQDRNERALAAAVRVTVMVGVMERGVTVSEHSAAAALLANAGKLPSGGAALDSEEAQSRTLRIEVVMDQDRFQVRLRSLEGDDITIVRDGGAGGLEDAHGVLLGLSAPVMPTLTVAPQPQTPLALTDFEAFGAALLDLEVGRTGQAREEFRRISQDHPDFLPAELLLRGAA
jgi:hypothetical protein